MPYFTRLFQKPTIIDNNFSRPLPFIHFTECHPIMCHTLYENAIVFHTLPIISPNFAIYCNSIQFALAISRLYVVTRTTSCAHHQNYPSTCHFRFNFCHGYYSNGPKFDLWCIKHCLHQRLWLRCSFDFGTIYVSFINFITPSLTTSQHLLFSAYGSLLQTPYTVMYHNYPFHSNPSFHRII